MAEKVDLEKFEHFWVLEGAKMLKTSLLKLTLIFDIFADFCRFA
jgi:hypothetical protein